MSSLAPLPVVVPLAGAVAALFLNLIGSRRLIRAVTVATVLAEVVLAAVLLHQAHASTIVYWFGAWKPRAGIALGISFTVDQAGAGAAVLAGIATAVAVAVLPSTMTDESPGIVHALVLTLLAAMAGFCLSGDLFNMFVFFELMAVAAFVLAAFDTRNVAALRSALTFAITSSIGAFLLLIGIAILYSRTGALNLAQIGHALALGGTAGRATAVAFALIAVGFLVKAAVVPFHFWLVDTASTAPLPLVIVLAAVLDALGVYGIARIFWTVFAGPLGPHEGALRAVLIGLGALTAVTAAVMSVAVTAPRPRLAFVMIAHTGLLLIGVGCLTARGLAGALVYAVADGTSKAAIFIGLALAGRAGAHTLEGPPAGPGAVAGRAAVAPGAGAGAVAPGDVAIAPGGGVAARAGWVLIVVGGLATAGLPLFGTGLGKAVIEGAAVDAGYAWVTGVFVAAAALTGGAVIDLGLRCRRAPAQARPVGSPLLPALGALLLAVSAATSTLGAPASRAAARFVDVAGYQARVLNGAPTARLQAPSATWTVSGVVLDLLAVAGAFAVALALAGGAGVVRRLRASTAVSLARRLHNGSIGDAATWATVGTAVVTLLCAR